MLSVGPDAPRFSPSQNIHVGRQFPTETVVLVNGNLDYRQRRGPDLRSLSAAVFAPTIAGASLIPDRGGVAADTCRWEGVSKMKPRARSVGAVPG